MKWEPIMKKEVMMDVVYISAEPPVNAGKLMRGAIIVVFKIGADNDIFGGTQNPGVPGWDQITVFPRSTGVSSLTEVMGDVRHK